MHILANNLSKKILTWYDNNKRTLPWRISQKSKKNLYYRIISEFMLQQTQVKTVIPYFKNFIDKFPNLKTLSKSNEKKILKLWEGLGYYRRARNLHKTAKILVKNYNGKLPSDIDEIKKLPGIGEYTANALLALVYNQSRIAIDGNVKRVFSRLFNLKKEINEKLYKEKFIKLFRTNRNADLVEALMEFGAVVCKPNNPLCNICKLKVNCYFFKNKNLFIKNKKLLIKEKKYNIFCRLEKQKKQIALTKNKSLSFLNNFNIPKTQVVSSNQNKKINGWIYLCSYKNNISNIKMDINLYYKFTKKIPRSFKWYFIYKPGNEFMPSFTKKILKKINKVYK